jgi:hypothetical protein
VAALLAGALLGASGLALAVEAPPRPSPSLPGRVRLVVLHTPGGPDYARPERRWSFLSPRDTFALWRRPSFGAHWIVWTDGSIWPRRPAEGEPASFVPQASGLAGGELAGRLVRHAAPVLSHVEGANTRSLGIEVAHSGRSDDPFPPEQVAALAWLLRSLFAISRGRLDAASVVGHKDLDRQPAWVPERCPGADCPVYVDEEGRPYRRRVDPPEGLFAALERRGLVVPREWAQGDAELLRAQGIPAGAVPRAAPAAER